MSKRYVMATFDVDGNKLTCAAPAEALVKLFLDMNQNGQQPEISSKNIDRHDEYIWNMFLTDSSKLSFKAKMFIKSLTRDFITIAGFAGLALYIMHSIGILS